MSEKVKRKSKKEIKVEPLLFDSYLAVIENSVGTNMFRNFYAKVNGRKTDVTIDGVRSCAFFVSAILMIFGLIKEVHRTYQRVVEDMEESGWYRIKKPRIGAVLVWERKKMGGKWFGHIGFYIGRREAVSNSTPARVPKRHHWTFDGKRKVKEIWWHRRLRKERGW